MNFGIPLDSREIVNKYIDSLHNYIRHSLLLFEPPTTDEASVKAMPLERRGMHEQNDHPKRIATTKKTGEKSYCTHCEKEGHDEESCCKLHTELRCERNEKKGKQKTDTTMQKNQDSESEEDEKVAAVRFA